MYDTETGFYYLTTRYYDPDVGRFLNADSYVSTGVGLDGYNMFAYCNSNPVNNVDENGEAPLKVARQLLTHWLGGTGEDLILGNDSNAAKALRKSKTMQNKIEEDLKKYENGEKFGSGDVTFESGESDLWLAFRTAHYEVSYRKERKTFGFGRFKKTKTRYIAYVTVSDYYNFNKGDETGDGLGSILNNFAFHANDRYGIGTNYNVGVSYVYKTQWTYE